MYKPLLAFLLLLSLTACATSRNSQPLNDVDFGSVTDPRAQSLLRSGRVEAAADRYSTLASRTSDPLQNLEYNVIAAEILYDRGIVDSGADKLSVLPAPAPSADPATLALMQRIQILYAKDALFNRDADAALAALPNSVDVVSPLHRARVYEVQAQSFNVLQQPELELEARIALETQLTNPDVIDRNHAQIWQLLTTQPLSRLREMTTNVSSDTYQGWLELALAHSGSGVDAAQREASLERWGDRFSAHPARPRFVATLYNPEKFGGFTTTSRDINQIAVLLPLSAPGIGDAAEAIRDGIVVAWQSDQDRAVVPSIRFYDTGTSASSIRTVFQSAINDGASAVIGPLRKDAVTALVTQRDIAVPVITLNYVDASLVSATDNIVQFGLAPEDEAREAALRGAGLGYRSAIVLKSDDSRGDREARAFEEEFSSLGGRVVSQQVLPTEEYDYSQQIRDALLISAGDQRFRSLSRALGRRLFFEPSIRNDVDMVFLAVGTEQARSVRPQLAFFRAAQLPKMGTARILSYDNNERANRDLNTIYFSDAPWVLDPAVRQDPLYIKINSMFSEPSDVFSKLYALGMDAYFLMTNLNTLSDPTAGPFKGYTGELTLTGNGRIRRALPWAYYDNGKLVGTKRVVPKAVVNTTVGIASDG